MLLDLVEMFICVIGPTSNDGVREGIGSDLGDDSL